MGSKYTVCMDNRSRESAVIVYDRRVFRVYVVVFFFVKGLQSLEGFEEIFEYVWGMKMILWTLQGESLQYSHFKTSKSVKLRESNESNNARDLASPLQSGNVVHYPDTRSAARNYRGREKMTL